MDDSVVNEIVARGAQFLPKPFSPEVLVHKVRDVLDRPWRGLANGRAAAENTD
jgi:DNA-binding response OmpR family regulator